MGWGVSWLPLPVAWVARWTGVPAAQWAAEPLAEACRGLVARRLASFEIGVGLVIAAALLAFGATRGLARGARDGIGREIGVYLQPPAV